MYFFSVRWQTRLFESCSSFYSCIQEGRPGKYCIGQIALVNSYRLGNILDIPPTATASATILLVHAGDHFLLSAKRQTNRKNLSDITRRSLGTQDVMEGGKQAKETLPQIYINVDGILYKC